MDPPKKRAKKSDVEAKKEPEIVRSLRRLDPVLQFLTKATGKPNLPLATLRAALPVELQADLLVHMPELAHRGVIYIQPLENGAEEESFSQQSTTLLTSWNDAIQIGFPPPPSLQDSLSVSQQQSESGTLHGSTKTAAKRRLAALRKSMKAFPDIQSTAQQTPEPVGRVAAETTSSQQQASKQVSPNSLVEKSMSDSDSSMEEPILEEEQMARKALDSLFNFLPAEKRCGVTHCEAKDIAYPLPRQASYAGSNPGRVSLFGELSESTQAKIPSCLLDAFGLKSESSRSFKTKRRLYHHQADAIDSAMNGTHTIVCTGTGSGKSLCFLLPVLTVALNETSCTSLVMFPTKALAQDQMSKLVSLLQSHPELSQYIKPGIIDGDTPHSQRSHVANHCNVILTNPDTLHAAILPNWKKLYRPILERVKYVVMDEAHMYEGVFGAHVSLVLSRLTRLCTVCCAHPNQLPTFLACSATISHPEHHFRLLCPIPGDAPVKVVTPSDDGSPRSPKHFFVWNPPIMDINGSSTGRVTHPRKSTQEETTGNVKIDSPIVRAMAEQEGITIDDGKFDHKESESSLKPTKKTTTGVPVGPKLYRRHAADETALLLAKAVANNVRCIVFCKTRSLVEWVYERTVSALRSRPSTQHLVSRVESYRGGYTAEARRLIEQRLFQNKLLGVVGTSALELGVDIGGIDLTLHCGYPTSYSSLLQQAGRAGRGGALDVPSVAVMICFNSPCEQHIWRHPSSLLSRGIALPPSIPLNSGLVQGHMLCAGAEFPLTGEYPVSALLGGGSGLSEDGSSLSDFDLLGSKSVYLDSMEYLVSKGSLVRDSVAAHSSDLLAICKTHPSLSKPWLKVSLRSIEPINYSIVDMSHPLQGGRMDSIQDEAVLDTIPYSRVFYHAFPGAVIIHRGKKYEVQCMTRPPPFTTCSQGGYRGSCSLGAFAKPTRARYFTRPLSSMLITIVKQMERVDSAGPPQGLPSDSGEKPMNHGAPSHHGSFAGNGVVTVKREVHGYKKLSSVTRAELSRSEISLPPMEFDTYAVWIDTEASALSGVLHDYDAGVHALSHALLAVAPLFVPCSSSDIDCDHSFIGCTRIILFDVRAGGAGTCAQLWKSLFMPNGLISAAIDLLETCPSCDADRRYEGGCPACLQAGNCLKFNQHLSRSAGLVIAKRMLERIKHTSIYQDKSQAQTSVAESTVKLHQKQVASSPRRRARAQALRNAKDLSSARDRQIVVGRPSWPLDDETGGRHENAN